jgi:hypothetical protein
MIMVGSIGCDKILVEADCMEVVEVMQNRGNKEVSLTHLVREVDVQPSHPGSNPHGRRSGFLLFKNKNPL